MTASAPDEVVLAISPTPHGIAYAAFEAPLTPIDWGFKRIKDEDKNARSFEFVNKLCTALRPETLVIEDCETAPSKRQERVRRLYALIATLAETDNRPLARYSKERVRRTFREAGAIDRYEIAQAIASYIPAFVYRMPKVRKLWQSQDDRLAIFDAAALALTHYAFIPDEDEPP